MALNITSIVAARTSVPQTRCVSTRVDPVAEP